MGFELSYLSLTLLYVKIKKREPNDWQVVALAMHFDCPIWTEDKDFFGIGIATWNSQNVEIYLGS
ncbi:MAG: hypothetical protein IM565_14475 [Pseudanabaena sp. M109S1SP2A07QC]|nr:hypothetical protein [Pseudanabaena sp. M109S1SP2A07QC]